MGKEAALLHFWRHVSHDLLWDWKGNNCILSKNTQALSCAGVSIAVSQNAVLYLGRVASLEVWCVRQECPYMSASAPFPSFFSFILPNFAFLCRMLCAVGVCSSSKRMGHMAVRRLCHPGILFRAFLSPPRPVIFVWTLPKLFYGVRLFSPWETSKNAPPFVCEIQNEQACVCVWM